MNRQTLMQRFDALSEAASGGLPGGLSGGLSGGMPVDRLVLGEGSLADYQALAEHHYLAKCPRTMTRILALRDPTPDVVDRYLHRRTQGQVVAVLVESFPVLSCTLRDCALERRYADLPVRQRARLLNDEMRCISRVVVDPRWRGLGLAVRLVAHALATATTHYTESLASMGRISPFFERAGMIAYHRPPLPADARLLAALLRADLSTADLATPKDTAEKILHLPTAQRDWLIRELTRWYRTAGGRGISVTGDLWDYLKAARRRLLASPVYYLHARLDPCPVSHE